MLGRLKPASLKSSEPIYLPLYRNRTGDRRFPFEDGKGAEAGSPLRGARHGLERNVHLDRDVAGHRADVERALPFPELARYLPVGPRFVDEGDGAGHVSA